MLNSLVMGVASDIVGGCLGGVEVGGGRTASRAFEIQVPTFTDRARPRFALPPLSYVL